MPTLFPLLQLKPGSPLPSPEDLKGKILIKNKKNQFSGKEAGGEPEGSCPPSTPASEDSGGSQGVGDAAAGPGEGQDLETWPPHPGLTQPCEAMSAGEEMTELEEKEAADEEDEELGCLDEEEIKKMQSDEVCVCGDSGIPDPFILSTVLPGVGDSLGPGPRSLPHPHPTPSSLFSSLLPRAQQAWR